MARGGSANPTARQRPQQGDDVVSTAMQLLERPAERTPFVFGGDLPPSDERFAAQIVTALVALAAAPLSPELITPAALILKAEGFVDLPAITFGATYSLNIRSYELDSGYARALDSGRLKLRYGKVSVNEHFSPAPAPDEVRTRANELFSLTERELMRVGRHHLLREAKD